MVLRGSTKTIQNTFTDKDGLRYDPTSHSIKYYDPSSVLKATQTTPTKDTVGVFHDNYEVPADAEYGRWLCVWEATVGTEKSTDYFAFYVVATTEPTVKEVRSFLNDITEEDISDSAIEESMFMASGFVSASVGSGASLDDVVRAKIAYAGFLAYGGYAGRLERGFGVLPPAVRVQLEYYRTKAVEYVDIARRGAPVVVVPQAMPLSRYEAELEEGEFEERG